jgi:hypothetical protein
MCCAICCLVSAGPGAPDPAVNAPVKAPVSATVVTAATATAAMETGALMRRRPLAQPTICLFCNLPMACFSSQLAMGVLGTARSAVQKARPARAKRSD